MYLLIISCDPVVTSCDSLVTLCNIIKDIDVVRNKITSFVHQKVTLPPGRHKVIIMDEAYRLG